VVFCCTAQFIEILQRNVQLHVPQKVVRHTYNAFIVTSRGNFW